MQIKPDATVCSLIYITAESLYMFRVAQHPSSGVLKNVTTASGTCHNIRKATSLQRGQIGFLVLLMMGAVTPETRRVILE